MRKLISLLIFSCAVAALAQSPNDGQSWWNYVKVLADDNMEGRETGSAGYDRAAAYVVEQAKADGLQPAGVNGFYQPVKFRSKQIDESQSSLALVRDGKVEPMVLGDDVMFSTRVDLAPSVDAPLVFVGYGLRVPEANYDDFAGLDVKGKVVVILAGSPSTMSAALASHYQAMAQRSATLRATGAVGYISIPNPASMDIPGPACACPGFIRAWSWPTNPSTMLRVSNSRSPGIHPLRTNCSPEWSHLDEIAALGKDRKPLPRFVLPVSIQARAKVIVTDVTSKNIVARLPGSDPKLKAQNVVLSAHLDHIGIGEPINGDKLYNGAMDNGSGSALLLDIAAHLAQSKTKPRRSLLFVAVTAEEKGLLGSRYFAANPTVPAKSIVADVNTDMFFPLPFEWSPYTGSTNPTSAI